MHITTSQVPVEYDGLIRCTTAVTASGKILMDIPDEAVAKLQNGTAQVNVFTQKLRPTDDEPPLEQIIRIRVDVFE